jgi:tRNA threonylcarbamoyladenosine biosynthesis protein TsaE
MSEAVLFESSSPEETRAFAHKLAEELQPGAILALHGDLGAGKTCFVQGLAAAMGVKATVSSPTYTLIQEYHCTPPLYHIDLYRLSGSGEAWDLGIEEYLYGQGITAIEWAERATALLPNTTRHLFFEHGDSDEHRRIRIEREVSP